MDTFLEILTVTLQYVPSKFLIQEVIGNCQPLITESGSEQRDGTALLALASH